LSNLFGIPDKRVICFEELGFLSVPLVFIFYLLGCRIYCFSINQKLRKTWFIQKLIRKEILKIIDYSYLDRFDQLEINNTVLDEIEQVYKENFSDNPTVARIIALVDSDFAADAFKKRVLLNLYDFHRMNFFFDKYFKLHIEKGMFTFVPGSIYHELRNVRQVQDIITRKKTRNSLWGNLFNFLSSSFLRFKYCLTLICFPLWISLKIRIPSFEKEITKNYLVGIRMSSSDWPAGNKYRKFDFLLDDKYLTGSNTLFCIEDPVSEDLKKIIRYNDYSTVEIRSLLRNASFSFCKKVLLKSFFPAYSQCLKNMCSDPLFIVQLCPEILFRYSLWMRFQDKYKISHYITYNEHLSSDIIRNLVLEKQNVRTWLYAHSIGTNDYFTSPGRKEIREKLYAYFYYDNYVVWGEKMKKYYQRHPNNIKNFYSFGCLWSEHVKKIQDQHLENSTLNALQKKFFKNNSFNPERIIGVFDVSTGDDAPLVEKDMVIFIKGILQILEDYPRFGIIFKNKWSLKKISLWTPSLIEYYEKIDNHPRCYLTDERGSDPAETIAASDLIISAPFTSPSIESLGAKKRAIYFDASGKFRDSYYDTFPRFVAHDYLELKNAVSYWLNEISEEQFHVFLDRYILHEIDEYLDGLAITRFRRELCSNESSIKKSR